MAKTDVERQRGVKLRSEARARLEGLGYTRELDKSYLVMAETDDRTDAAVIVIDPVTGSSRLLFLQDDV